MIISLTRVCRRSVSDRAQCPVQRRPIEATPAQDVRRESGLDCFRPLLSGRLFVDGDSELFRAVVHPQLHVARHPGNTQNLHRHRSPAPRGPHRGDRRPGVAGRGNPPLPRGLQRLLRRPRRRGLRSGLYRPSGGRVTPPPYQCPRKSRCCRCRPRGRRRQRSPPPAEQAPPPGRPRDRRGAPPKTNAIPCSTRHRAIGKAAPHTGNRGLRARGPGDHGPARLHGLVRPLQDLPSVGGHPSRGGRCAGSSGAAGRWRITSAPLRARRLTPSRASDSPST